MSTTVMSNVEKQYGLIEIKTGKKLTVNDVFNNDSDSGGENDGNRLKKSNLPKMDAVLKRQTKLEMERALEQDPTVYQYDEVYDEMNQTKQDIEKAKTNVDRKPKYIHNLMRTAEKRKQENERRLERQIQKEREAEGDMFKDKEEFITSSYKQKLEEFKKADEEEKKMEYIESVMDVSKQQDLGGFYRHLYRETVANEGKENVEDENIEDKVNKEQALKPDVRSDIPKHQSERNYRKRNSAESIGGEEKMAKKDSSSSSSDSDSSSDSSSSSTSSSSDSSDKEGHKKSSENVSNQNVAKAAPETSDSTLVSRNEKENDQGKDMSKSAKQYQEKNKVESKDEKLRSHSKRSRSDERSRRNKNYRSSIYRREGDERSYVKRGRRSYDRDRNRNRERERERNRGRERDRRDYRDERRNSDSKRSRSLDRKNSDRSRGRSNDCNKLRRDNDRGKDSKGGKNYYEEKRTKEVKEIKKDVPLKGSNEIHVVEEQPRVSIWEKRTVGSVFDAALERYKLRKAARGS